MRKVLQMSLLLLLVAALLGGCSRFAVPRPEPSRAEENFSNRLRWLDIQGAAHYLQPEYRQDFREHFAALEGLHITDVRPASGEEVDPQHLESTMEIDYYLLPSLTVKTRYLHLTWQYVDLGRWQSGYWQIVGPFPDFP
jgi:hypothetical protein